MKPTLLILFAAVSASGASAPSQGSSWSLLPSSTRDAGLAGGMASLASGVDGYALDPAALARTGKLEAYLSHTQWHQEVRLDHAALAVPVGRFGALALGLDWADFGTITRYEAAPGGGFQPAGTLHPSAGALTAGWGFKLSQSFSAGVTARGWRQVLDQDSDLAASGGASLRYSSRYLQAVAAANALGTPLGGSALPAQTRLGIAVCPYPWASIGAEVLRFNSDGSNDLLAAVELHAGQSLSLRGGLAFQGEARQQLGTVGASFKAGSLGLELAGLFHPQFGPALQAGLAWSLR